MLNEQRPPRSSLGMIPFLFHWLWNAPDCCRSRPMQRWWKCWFTGVIIWDSRQSYKQQGRLLLAPLRPSPWPVRFIVNYGRLRGRRSRVHSYINLVLFMGNYKTPRIFFPPSSWDWLWSCSQVLSFFKTCLLVDFWSLESFAAAALFNSRHLLWLKAIWLICCHL